MDRRSDELNVTAMSSSRRGSVVAAGTGVYRRTPALFRSLGGAREIDYGRGTWNMVAARELGRDDGLGAWSPPHQTFGIPSLIYPRSGEAVTLSAMILAVLCQWLTVQTGRAFERWRDLRLPHKFALAACLLVLAGMTYVGVYVT